MSDTGEISDLIGGIYDAALEPALWTNVLDKITKFVGGHAAALYFKDASSKTGFSMTWGSNPITRKCISKNT